MSNDFYEESTSEDSDQKVGVVQGVNRGLVGGRVENTGANPILVTVKRSPHADMEFEDHPDFVDVEIASGGFADFDLVSYHTFHALFVRSKNSSSPSTFKAAMGVH